MACPAPTAPQRLPADWAVVGAGLACMSVHQLLIVGMSLAILFLRDPRYVCALFGALLAIYGMFIAFDGCVLSIAERRFYKIDVADAAGRLLVPGYVPEDHRAIMGVGKILSGLYMCGLKLGVMLGQRVWTEAGGWRTVHCIASVCLGCALRLRARTS